MLFFINGQGVPPNIHADGGYARYLSECWRLMEDHAFLRRACGLAYARAMRADDQSAMDFLLLRAPYGRTVYVGGGRYGTCGAGRTEFDCVTDWFAKNGLTDARFRSLDGPDLTARLQALAHELGREKSVVVFCGYAEQDLARFLCRRLFTCAVVVPVRFSAGRIFPIAERLRSSLSLPRLVAGWYAREIMTIKVG